IRRCIEQRHENGRVSAVLRGMHPATKVIAVSLVPTKLSALVLVASMLMAAGGSVFAQASHLICVANQHDCGKTATIAKACCGRPDASRTDSTTALTRVEVRADLTLTPALPLFVQMVAARP